MVCTKFNSRVYKLKRCAIGSTFVSILQLAVQRGASIGECPMSQKIGDGPINMAPSKKKNKSVIELFGGTYSKSISNGAEYVTLDTKIKCLCSLSFFFGNPPIKL